MKTISLKELPAIGAALDAGLFAGVITDKNGRHCAVILLPDQAKSLDWTEATAWAKALDAELPSRPVAALLFANLRDQLRRLWHWTSDEYEGEASSAWYCYFSNGYQDDDRKSSEGAAVAVRLIPLA